MRRRKFGPNITPGRRPGRGRPKEKNEGSKI